MNQTERLIEAISQAQKDLRRLQLNEVKANEQITRLEAEIAALKARLEEYREHA